LFGPPIFKFNFFDKPEKSIFIPAKNQNKYRTKRQKKEAKTDKLSLSAM